MRFELRQKEKRNLKVNFFCNIKTCLLKFADVQQKMIFQEFIAQKVILMWPILQKDLVINTIRDPAWTINK